MLLYLLRHANAEHTSPSRNDKDRPLSSIGINQAVLLGDYVSTLNLIETSMYISSSLRTIETENYALKSCTNNKEFHDELYLTSSKELMKFINGQNTTNNILILGHNEGISALASYLTDQYIALNTANCITIEFDCVNSNEISGSMGKIIDFFNPL